jgi:hypothetical protein
MSDLDTGVSFSETLYHLDLDAVQDGQLFWNTVDGIVLDVPDRESSASLEGGFASSWITSSPGLFSASLANGVFTPGGAFAVLPWVLTYEGSDIVRAQLLPVSIPVMEATYRIPDTLLVPTDHYRESLLMNSDADVAVSCCPPVMPVDGLRDPAYIGDLARQTNQTAFGNSDLGVIDLASGSELDVATPAFRDDTLHVFLGGNLESNFNRLELFFDTVPGGQNRLRGDNADIDFNGLNRMGDDGSGNGLRFDPGFEADRILTLSGGVSGGSYKLFASFATLPTAGGGAGSYLGWTGAGGDGTLEGGANTFRIRAAIDNSNVGGVSGGCGADDPGAVTTGIEVAIPLSALGNPTGCIKMLAFINGASHDFVSNQMLGPLPTGTCNLGDPRFVDLGLHSGNQSFLVCVPVVLAVEPSVAASQDLLRAWPNPFRNQLRLQLVGRPGQPVRVDIFDVAGRKVRSLSKAAWSSPTLTWDGKADDGRATSAGVYMVRARTDNARQTTSVLHME